MTSVDGRGITAPLLEREDELHTLHEAIDGAAQGRGALVLVEGPAGIGKTGLIDAAAEAALPSGALVRRARAGEMERDLPFGVVRQLFGAFVERAIDEQRADWLTGSARQALAALGVGDASSQQAVDELAAMNGVYWLVANLSETQPLVLLIDDAHSSDSDSLRFVAFLGRRINELPVLLMLGARTGEAREPPELNALRLEASIIRPAPLSESSVHALIARQSGRSPSERFSRACATVTGGNPFLVVEILREFGGAAELDDDATESIARVAPENVARSVVFRLGRFGEHAIAVARAIAVLGRSPQLRYVAALADLSDEETSAICDQLRGAEILAPGLSIDFVHPLVRQAIYAEQSEGHRSIAHRRAAAVLADADSGPFEIASHLLACVPNGDQWVVQSLLDAAVAAMNEGGYESAVRYLERALEEPPRDPTPLLLSLGIALVEVDPFRAPVTLAQAVQTAPDERERLDVLRQLVWAHLSTGNLIDAADACDQALDIAPPTQRELRLALEAQRLFMRAAAQGFDPAMTAHIESVADGLAGDTPGEIVARQALAIPRYGNCAPVKQVVDLCLPFPEPPWEIEGGPSPVPFAAAKLLAWSGQWDVARKEVAAWMEAITDQGRLIALSAANSFLAEIERLSGRLADSESLARTAWEIAESAPRFTSFGWSAWMNLAATLLARGDLEAFDHLIGTFDLASGPLEVPLNPWPLEIRAQLRLARGDFQRAADDYLALGTALEERIGWLNPVYPPWRQEATEALAALGKTSEATELITVAEKRARSFGAPHGIASVLRARAFTEPRGRAIQTLAESGDLLDKHGPPHELARSLIELGATLRRDGRRSEAKEPLERGLELAHRCGAGALERRARDELRAIGSRPRQAYRTGPGALTASELRVARLAADGLNNREIAERLFVTRRTVETHLTHVYEKLGIEGRAGIAAALAEEASTLS